MERELTYEEKEIGFAIAASVAAEEAEAEAREEAYAAFLDGEGYAFTKNGDWYERERQ